MLETILITGGTGFIGSHTYVALSNAGYNILVVDNLSNSQHKVLGKLQTITGKEPCFFEGDIRDSALLNKIFANYTVSAVIHFAGLKAVGESVKKPLEYYDNNVCGTICLLNAMRMANVKKIIFSSSATVYGAPKSVPIFENFPLKATNPYGETKLMIENILRDLHQSEPDWHIACLRYFNPVGAHHSGLIGEDPLGIPNNLMPYIAQVATGHRDNLLVFGGDYPTVDGTGVRDYIHVMDLANGHVAALNYFLQKGGLITLNLGRGCGVSVLEMIKAFETTNNCKIPYRIVSRRTGDIPESWTNTSLAEKLLSWKAQYNIEDMCRDVWNWQIKNSKNYTR